MMCLDRCVQSVIDFAQAAQKDTTVTNFNELMEQCIDQVDGLKDCSKLAAHSKGVFV